MLNTTQAAALHAFNNNGSQGRLTETSLARALKSEKVIARTTITTLREKGMIAQAGKYEFRITDAGKKHLKTISSKVSSTLNKAFSPANEPAASETTAADVSEQRVTAVLETQPIEHRGEHHLAKAIEQLEQLDHQQDDTVDIDEELNALLDLQLVKAGGEMLQLNEPASTNALLDAELTTLAEMLDPNQYPVIDDIDSKQHALAGIAVLLKQRTPALARLADQLATDLSVIRLHQERRV
ncbi:MAG: hypothetical protein KKE94_07910 [Gammaproteobacteria bacterium]|nr:hypothetical protein [Gammaproteobacteria bacterium]